MAPRLVFDVVGCRTLDANGVSVLVDEAASIMSARPGAGKMILATHAGGSAAMRVRCAMR
ncbi:hypothetical protein WS68_21240 [Burkholderia sp. TSV86]|nr:hypothetical protein WS68_21240 [Burkholderia sp. TSV86]